MLRVSYMITDPAEPYFTPGGWYWNGSNWQRERIPFRISEIDAEEVADTNAGAGTQTLSGTVVPADRIWVITAAHAVNSTSAITRAVVNAYVNGVYVRIAHIETPVIGEPCTFSGHIPIPVGDKLTAHFYGVVAGDTIRLRYTYYTMVIG
jgi:hypothetical protein